MKSESELLQELAKLRTDERVSYPTANVVINAPLALVQITLETRIHALEWVLGLPRSVFPLPKTKKNKKKGSSNNETIPLIQSESITRRHSRRK